MRLSVSDSYWEMENEIPKKESTWILCIRILPTLKAYGHRLANFLETFVVLIVFF